MGTLSARYYVRRRDCDEQSRPVGFHSRELSCKLSVKHKLSSQFLGLQSKEDARLRAYVVGQYECRTERKLSPHESYPLAPDAERHQTREGEPSTIEEHWQPQYFTFLNPVTAKFCSMLEQSKNTSSGRFRAAHTGLEESSDDTKRKVLLLRPTNYQDVFADFCVKLSGRIRGKKHILRTAAVSRSPLCPFLGNPCSVLRVASYSLFRNVRKIRLSW